MKSMNRMILLADCGHEPFQTLSEKSASLELSRFSVHYSGPQGLITWSHHSPKEWCEMQILINRISLHSQSL